MSLLPGRKVLYGFNDAATVLSHLVMKRWTQIYLKYAKSNNKLSGAAKKVIDGKQKLRLAQMVQDAQSVVKEGAVISLLASTTASHSS